MMVRRMVVRWWGSEGGIRVGVRFVGGIGFRSGGLTTGGRYGSVEKYGGPKFGGIGVPETVLGSQRLVDFSLSMYQVFRRIL